MVAGRSSSSGDSDFKNRFTSLMTELSNISQTSSAVVSAVVNFSMCSLSSELISSFVIVVLSSDFSVNINLIHVKKYNLCSFRSLYRTFLTRDLRI